LFHIDLSQIELAFLLLGVLALSLIKTSVCVLFWHLFAKVKFRRFLIVWIVVLIAWRVSFIIAGLLECGTHLKALFGTPDGYLHHCGSAIPDGWAYVGSDVATDFITLVIPLPIVSRPSFMLQCNYMIIQVFSLQLSLSRKLLVAATFMVGGL
jgi:hypothetical protein